MVIELKKGMTSDKVVGQILRYMGWAKQNLYLANQKVKGLVICKNPDPKLILALSMTNDIAVKYYNVSIELKDQK